MPEDWPQPECATILNINHEMCIHRCHSIPSIPRHEWSLKLTRKSLPVLSPSSVTLMIKPVGALCNLDCTYCYYLPTKSIYDHREHRMKLDTLESIYAGYLPKAADQVTICWQGGEPTLAGLKFFEKAIEFQHKHKRPGQTIANALQTNGTLLDDNWCKFLRDNRFLIGISIDGPAHYHDHYRVTNAGTGSHDKVLNGLRKLQEHDVEYNILCVLNQRNIKQPTEVFQYLLNLGSRWIQFIPEIVWEADPDHPGRTRLADHCPSAADYGQFMNKVFDLWFERYRQRVSIRLFDSVLNKLVHDRMPLCILDGSCHGQLTVEHNGDVFGCDHFVERRWQLARIGDPQWVNPIDPDGTEHVGLTIHHSGYKPNRELHGRDIHNATDLDQQYSADQDNGNGTSTVEEDDKLDRTWFDHADAGRLAVFAERKQNLPDKCLNCEWKTYCYGGCPEHRPMGGDEPEASVLCEGYILFYNHAMERMRWLAGYLKRGMQPPPAMINQDTQRAQDSEIGKRIPVPAGAAGKVGRNDPCPCGSGLKYKKCCGR